MLPYLRQALGMLGELTAIDVAEEMLARARAKHSELALFLQADAAVLPQTENSVDAILCYSVFPHFEQPQAVLREFFSGAAFWRTLGGGSWRKPGGH